MIQPSGPELTAIFAKLTATCMNRDPRQGRTVCFLDVHHDGDHCNALGETWPQATATSPAALDGHASYCQRGEHGTAPCASETININVSGHPGGEPILQADISADEETGAPELRVDFGMDDWVVVTPAQMRQRLAAVRAHVDQLSKLADDFEAITKADA